MSQTQPKYLDDIIAQFLIEGRTDLFEYDIVEPHSKDFARLERLHEVRLSNGQVRLLVAALAKSYDLPKPDLNFWHPVPDWETYDPDTQTLHFTNLNSVPTNLVAHGMSHHLMYVRQGLVVPRSSGLTYEEAQDSIHTVEWVEWYDQLAEAIEAHRYWRQWS